MILKLGRIRLETRIGFLDGNYHGPEGVPLTKGFLFCWLGIRKGWGFRIYKYYADTSCKDLEVILSWRKP